MLKQVFKRPNGFKLTGFASLLSGTAAAVMMSTPAHAVGTLADTLVSNTVTVNFTIGGIVQTPVQATETFLVDNMVDVQVTATDTSVVPGETSATAYLTYVIENQGNATQGYALDIVYVDSGLTLSPSADANITEGEYGLFLDTDGNGVYTPGVDQFYSTAGELNAGDLAPDQQYTVFIVAYIPLDSLDGDIATFDVVATTLNAGTAQGAQGTVTTETAVPGIDSTDTVFVDAAGTQDVAEDGIHSDMGTFTVSGTDLTVSKTAIVINRSGENCLTATQDPDAGELFTIPGACIEYTITVTNNGSATASVVAISDPLPSDISFAGFHSSTSADFTNGEGDDVAPAYAAGTASATEATLLPGDSLDLVIRAIIN